MGEASPYGQCRACRRFLETYEAATRDLAPIAKELLDVAISYEYDAYLRISHRMQEAKKRCGKARLALEEHLRTHQTV